MNLDKTKRDNVKATYDKWVASYKAWKEETDATKKAEKKTTLDTDFAKFNTEFPKAAAGESIVNGDAPSGGSTAFIVIGVVLVLAAAIGGGLWYKKKNSENKEGGEADDRKLYKSQIASVNAHKKA